MTFIFGSIAVFLKGFLGLFFLAFAVSCGVALYILLLMVCGLIYEPER